MVTANLDNLSDEFETIISDRDVVSIGSIGLAGAGGGVIATQLAGRVAPLVGLDPQPTDTTGLVANGFIKMLVGAGLALAAIQLGGTVGVVLGVAGIGALILGGGDWINAVLSTDVGVPSAATRGRRQVRSRSTSGNSSARVVRTSSTRGSQSRDDEVEFRASGGSRTSGRSTHYDDDLQFR